MKVSRLLLLPLLLLLLFAAPAYAEYVAIVKTKANVRSGPGTNNKKAFTLEHSLNYPLKVLDKKGKWLKVQDYEGDVGWIAKFLTEKVKAVIVKKKAHVRKGPGKNHEKRWTAQKGETFRVLKKKGNWVNVIDSVENSGWIYGSLLWGANK